MSSGPTVMYSISGCGNRNVSCPRIGTSSPRRRIAPPPPVPCSCRAPSPAALPLLRPTRTRGSPPCRRRFGNRAAVRSSRSPARSACFGGGKRTACRTGSPAARAASRLRIQRLDLAVRAFGWRRPMRAGPRQRIQRQPPHPVPLARHRLIPPERKSATPRRTARRNLGVTRSRSYTVTGSQSPPATFEVIAGGIARA